LPALTLTAPRVGIPGIKGVTTLAMRLPVSRVHLASPVFAVGHRLQVHRVYACTVAAQMVELQPGWHRANQQFISEPVGPICPLAFPGLLTMP